MSLLPHQKANVALLIGLLTALPAEAYNHNYFGFGYGTEPTDSGCSLGLAMANREKFTDATGKPEMDSHLGLFAMDGWQETMFGVASGDEVFSMAATYPKAYTSSDVTKEMVIAKLKEYGGLTEVLA